MTADAGDLDVTFQPSGTQGFSDLKRDAVEIEAAARLHMLVSSLERDLLEARGWTRERSPGSVGTVLGPLPPQQSH